MLVSQIAENYWRLIRARNMETGSFKLGIKIEAEEYGINRVEPDELLRGANLATALSHHHEIFTRIARYETTAERSYYRAIRELQKLQALRSRREPSRPAPEIRSDPQSDPCATTKIRSVRQSAPSGIENAALPMSPDEMLEFLDRFTAPPMLKTGEQAG
jgi:hypothetical protein